MTDKELHKLSRRELLQLLLTQAKDTEELRRLSEEREEQLDSLRENYERLKKRLDHKDAQIHDLRMALHEERSNRRIELEEAGSIAEAALRLNGIFDMAQKAAEQYLYNIRLMHEKEAAYAEEFFGKSEQDPPGKDGQGAAADTEPEAIAFGEPEASETSTAGPDTECEEEGAAGLGTGDPEESMREPGTEEEEPGTVNQEEDIPGSETENPEEEVPEPEAEKQEARSRGGKWYRRHRK